MEATVKRTHLSPVTSLLVSLSLVVGILVCDLAGLHALPEANAQTSGAHRVAPVAVPAATLAGGVIAAKGVVINGVATDAVFLGKIRVSNSVVDAGGGISRYGDVEVLGAYPSGTLGGDTLATDGAYPSGITSDATGAYPSGITTDVTGAYPSGIVSNRVVDAGGGISRYGDVEVNGAYPSGTLGGDTLATDGAYPSGTIGADVTGAYPSGVTTDVTGAYPSGTIVIGDLQVVGGTLQGSNIQVTNGVVTGDNLVLVGAYVSTSGAR
jgi:hypothetical protein